MLAPIRSFFDQNEQNYIHTPFQLQLHVIKYFYFRTYVEIDM